MGLADEFSNRCLDPVVPSLAPAAGIMNKEQWEGYMQDECCPVWETQSHKEGTNKLMSKISTTGCEADPWPWAQPVAMPRHTQACNSNVLQSTPLHPLLTDITYVYPCVLRSDFYKAIKILRLMVYCLQIDSLLACEMPWWNMLHQPGLYPLINCRTQSMFSFKGKDSETTQLVSLKWDYRNGNDKCATLCTMIRKCMQMVCVIKQPNRKKKSAQSYTNYGAAIHYH